MVDLERVHPATRDQWRAWLQANHGTLPGAWVVHRKAAVAGHEPTYEDVVEEALCFGWIDGRANGLDDDHSLIRMTPRTPTGTWARSNKDRVERLIADGRMTAAGLRVIEAAKANGSWSVLDDVEALVVPEDLHAALALDPAARRHFSAFPPSAKKAILYWIKSAKRPETRRRRVAETVRLAAGNLRAPQPGRR